jgi:hypothetical protein
MENNQWLGFFLLFAKERIYLLPTKTHKFLEANYALFFLIAKRSFHSLRFF